MSPRHPKRFALIAFTALFGAGVSSLLAGEKIQLSVPQQKADFQIEQPRLKTPSSGSLNIEKSSPAATFATPFLPQPTLRRDKEADDKKRNWIFATPENSTPTPEEAFKVRKNGFEEDRDSAPTFFGQRMEDPRVAKTDEDGTTRDGKSESEKKEEQAREESKTKKLDDSDFSWQRSSATAAMVESRLNQLDRPGAFSDYWNERLNIYGGGNDQLAQRREQFNQLFQNRTTDPINSFGDATRQPLNPVTSTPSDLLGRSSASAPSQSFQNYNLSRGSVLDNPGMRSLGRGESPINTQPAAPIIARPQPSVLPFPSRPGELFR